MLQTLDTVVQQALYRGVADGVGEEHGGEPSWRVRVPRPLAWCLGLACVSFVLSVVLAKGSRKPLEGLAKLRAFTTGGSSRGDARGVFSYVDSVKATSQRGRHAYREVSEDVHELEACLEE